MRSNTRIILLDVGGTFVKASLGISGKGAVEGSFTHTPISSDGTAEEIQDAFRTAVGGQMEKAAEEGYEVSAVCVAIPGPFNYHDGVFMMKHKFAAVYGRSFREILGDVVPSDVRLAFIHDVNGALLGALTADPSLRTGNVAISTFGTGLGFAYAENGKVMESETGSPAKGLWDLPYMGGLKIMFQDVPSSDSTQNWEAYFPRERMSRRYPSEQEAGRKRRLRHSVWQEDIMLPEQRTL